MKVICITDKTAFPYGEATANRIKYIAKSLIEVNCEFLVISNYFNKNSLNKNIRGNFDGIEYRHSNIIFNRPRSIIKRMIFSLIGIVNIFFILRRENPKNTCLYLYSQGTFFNFLMQLYSKILSLKSIQEVNEWDYVENKGFLKEFFYKKTMFKHSNGAIVISSQIIENIKRYSKKKFNVIKIPVLNDPLEYAPIALNNLQKYGLWMGLVDGYYRDVEFIAQGVIQAYRTNPEIKMLICGRYSKVTKDKIEHILKQMNVPVSTITFKGYLTDGVLKELCLNASFFVVPLWNNAKSNNRFPTKIATFLFCGKPIITSPIGEVGNYLNSKNSILIEPGDNVGLGESMNKVLLDENFTKNLALNALMVAEKNFNYKSYSENLLNFFKEIIYYDKNS